MYINGRISGTVVKVSHSQAKEKLYSGINGIIRVCTCTLILLLLNCVLAFAGYLCTKEERLYRQ